MDGDHLPVMLLAVQSLLCPSNIHQTDEACGGFLERKRNQDLNNLIIFRNNQEMLPKQLILVQELVQKLFHLLGLTINYKKSRLIPTQELTFLGLMISTTSMTDLFL